MSFISNALGVNNGYTATNAGGTSATPSTVQQQTDLNNINNTYTAQGNLAQQLQGQANGQGPNIANLQLQQATNQNNQQAAGAIASQRGMNPALAARQIQQQTASNNQTAAGQSGVLRAQQQLAAQQGLANVYGQQAGEAANNYGTLTQAQEAANSQNAQVAQNNTNANAAIAGGIVNSGSNLISSILYDGGEVEATPEKHLERLLISIGSKVKPMHFDQGGGPEYSLGANTSLTQDDPFAAAVVAAPDSLFAGVPSGATTGSVSAGNPGSGSTGMAGSLGSTSTNNMDSSLAGGSASTIAGSFGQGKSKSGGGGGGLSSLAALLAQGGKVPAMISPGERYIPPSKVNAVASGKEKASEVGKKVPGRAKVAGNNPVNDTVPAALSPGGVIIKRTEAQNDTDSREFLKEIQKKKLDKQGHSGYAKILEAKRKVS